MKKITLILMFGAFFAASQFVNAQKLAHINSLQLLDAMPEREKADTDLKALQDQKLSAISTMEKDIQSKYQKLFDDLQNKAKGKSDAELEKMQPEAKKLQDDYQGEQKKLADLKESAAKELQAKQEELYKPIFQKAQDAINKVAKAKGYEYVLDSSTNAVLYLGGPDLLAEVKTELGLK